MHKRKKLIKIIAVILLLAVLLIPLPRYYKDGGTIEYHAVLYQIFHWHSIRGVDGGSHEIRYYDGVEVRVLGFTVYNDAKELEDE